VKLLLERWGVDPNRADVNGITPPARAATEGEEGVVKLFREWEDSGLDSESDQDGGGSFVRFAQSPGITGVSLCILFFMVRGASVVFQSC